MKTSSLSDKDWFFKQVGEYTWKNLGVSERELRYNCTFKEVMRYKECMSMQNDYENAEYYDTRPEDT